MDLGAILQSAKDIIFPRPLVSPVSRGPVSPQNQVPVSQYPGYQAAQQSGGFDTPQTLDFSGISNFVKGLIPQKTYTFDYQKPASPSINLDVPVPSPRAAMPTIPSSLSEIEQRTLPTFQQYGIPPAVAYGIAGAEGGKIGSNNIYNLGAYDSNPQNAFHYDSPEAAATASAKLLSGRYELGTPGSGKFDTRYLDAYKLSNDPVATLHAIYQAGYAGDPKTWKARSIATGGAGKYFDDWDEFVRSTPAWKKWFGSNLLAQGN
jgi:hypothetical protein